jgi:hypothetical protein
MEITLGLGSYCKVSSYQEGLESSLEHKDLCDIIESHYDYLRISDDLDY